MPISRSSVGAEIYGDHGVISATGRLACRRGVGQSKSISGLFLQIRYRGPPRRMGSEGARRRRGVRSLAQSSACPSRNGDTGEDVMNSRAAWRASTRARSISPLAMAGDLLFADASMFLRTTIFGEFPFAGTQSTFRGRNSMDRKGGVPVPKRLFGGLQFGEVRRKAGEALSIPG